jgi:hypothetical protein
MNRLKEDDAFWSKLVYNVCKGDPAGMRELKRMDIFDFFEFIENYERNGRQQQSRTNPNSRQYSTGKNSKRN